jgi:hypothetical protein
MDLALSEWRRFLVDGGVLLVPPEADEGRICVRERQPRVRLKTLVDDALAAAGALAELSAPPRPLVTIEGEAAATFSVTERHGALVCERTLGIVFGDESFTVIDGRAERPELFAHFAQLVEALTCDLALSHGSDRARRVRYSPPAGWQGVERVRSDVWLAPDHPRAPGMIIVFRARPTRLVDDAGARLQARLYEDLTVEHRETGEREPLMTAQGLEGELAHFSRVGATHEQRVAEAVLDGGWIRFRLRLVSDSEHVERDLATFASVIESVRPLPEPRQGQPAPHYGLLWRD